MKTRWFIPPWIRQTTGLTVLQRGKRSAVKTLLVTVFSVADPATTVGPLVEGTAFCEVNDDTCGDNIAVARLFASPPSSVHPDEFSRSPWDINGHGTHVAGTTAGNPVSASFTGVAL